MSRWVSAVWGAALHNQSRRSWFWSWPVFGERVGGIILVILYSDLDLRLRTIRTKVFSHKGKGNWPFTQLDSQLVDRMNEYYYLLDLVLIWLLKWTVFRTCVYFLPVEIKKCLKPLTLRKFIQLFPNSIQNTCKFLAIFYEDTIPGFESRKEIGLLLFGGQQVSPFLSSSHDPCQIVAKLSTPGPLYPTQRRPLAESTSQTATHLGKLGTALPGCFSFFQGTQDNSPDLSRPCSHTLAGQTTAVDPIVNSTGAKRGVCRWWVLVNNYF